MPLWQRLARASDALIVVAATQATNALWQPESYWTAAAVAAGMAIVLSFLEQVVFGKDGSHNG